MRSETLNRVFGHLHPHQNDRQRVAAWFQQVEPGEFSFRSGCVDIKNHRTHRINSLDLAAGSEILTTNHEYGAILNVWKVRAKEKALGEFFILVSNVQRTSSVLSTSQHHDERDGAAVGDESVPRLRVEAHVADHERQKSAGVDQADVIDKDAVSYTHLTLPTNREV